MPSPWLRAQFKIILNALACPKAHLTLLCVDDATIQELNGTWRNKPKVTDVLSFSQVEGDVPFPQGCDPELGDIVISMPCAQRQATARGHSLTAEMARLMVHGVLHLLGHDHVHGGRQAKRMRDEERRLLAALKVDIDI